MLTYWIPEGPCMLPANASHQVGVGGFVINDKNEVFSPFENKIKSHNHVLGSERSRYKNHSESERWEGKDG